MLTEFSTHNRLLRTLSASDLALLHPIEVMNLPLRMHLEHPGQPVEFAYFVETGVASVVLDNVSGKEIEVGLIGHEGMLGAGLAVGDRMAAFEAYMQVGGSGVRIEAGRLVAAMETSPSLRDLILRYGRAFSIQVAGTASSNGRAKLEERLARWLLMISDRMGTTFQITHEFIAIMLGVRRSGVTLAIAALEGSKLIRASRGSITVLDRDGLVEESAGAYGLPEAEYERLLSYNWGR